MKMLIAFVLSSILAKLGNYVVLDITKLEEGLQQQEEKRLMELQRKEKRLDKLYKWYYSD